MRQFRPKGKVTLKVLSWEEIGKAYKLKTVYGDIMVPRVWVHCIKRKKDVVSVEFSEYWLDALKTKINSLGIDANLIFK